MKTRFLLVFGLSCAALFVAAEAALYFYGMHQIESKMSTNLAVISSYATDLDDSYQTQDSVRFRELCDEIQRKLLLVDGVQDFRIEHQKYGLLYSVKFVESNHQLKEQTKKDNALRFVLQFAVLDAQSTGLLLKVGFIILLLWIGGSVIGLGLHDDRVTTNPQPDGPTKEPIPPIEPAAEKAPPPLSQASSIINPPPSVTGSRTSFSEFLYKLDKELSRCAEFAVELALCLVRIPKLKNPQLAKTQLAAEFIHEDLIFQLENRLFAIILPHHDLDQALARSELFLKSIDRYAVDNPEVIDSLIGVASRSSRLVDGKRVYQEATIALRKANSQHGRMVGFRADPTRYRNYLTHQKI
jgi:hypothetical protein